MLLFNKEGNANKVFNGDALSRSQELEYARKAAHGDHDAFRHLVLAYETSILTYLQSILGDWESARDLTQETFIAAFYALPRWQPPESLTRWQSIPQKNAQGARSLMDHPLAPWLYRIATNHALTFLKQQGRYKRAGASLPLEYHPDINQISESIGESQGAVEGWENGFAVRELLHEALSQLSTDDALCIVLRFVAGERYAEIAERFGMTKEAVRKRVARGLLVLHSVYQALDKEK
ncbi:MAG: RNA polymerase sigma factor [Chloroflexota bacterium]|nr:RNA polymerase sigma factor [Chloroflexota bacterium]